MDTVGEPKGNTEASRGNHGAFYRRQKKKPSHEVAGGECLGENSGSPKGFLCDYKPQRTMSSTNQLGQEFEIAKPTMLHAQR